MHDVLEGSVPVAEEDGHIVRRVTSVEAAGHGKVELAVSVEVAVRDERARPGERHRGPEGAVALAKHHGHLASFSDAEGGLAGGTATRIVSRARRESQVEVPVAI